MCRLCFILFYKQHFEIPPMLKQAKATSGHQAAGWGTTNVSMRVIIRQDRLMHQIISKQRTLLLQSFQVSRQLLGVI